MTEHYDERTVGVLVYCNKCGRRTIHSVSDKRLGHCTEHKPEGLSKRQEAERKRLDSEKRNPKLF